MSERPPCLAVIPACRGLARGACHHVGDLAGKPLIARAILAARGAPSITRVVVSTDDVEIARVAQTWGAEALPAVASASEEATSPESVLLHVLDLLRLREGYAPELVMLVQNGFPLTTAADLEGLVHTLRSERADSAFTAAPLTRFLWTRGPDGSATGSNHGAKQRKQGQSVEPQYIESGAAYVMRAKVFLDSQERFCGRVVMHLMQPSRGLEVQSHTDFAIGEAALRGAEEHELSAVLPRDLAAVVFDFDGVFTDNGVLVLEDGREAVRCDRGDGLGLSLLRQLPVRVLILSKEQNRVVSARAQKLKLECMQGIDDKPRALAKWLLENGLQASSTIYVGNDVNDLECMRMVGCAFAPSDSHPTALAAATRVLSKPGGHGAVRELCDAIVAHFASR